MPVTVTHEISRDDGGFINLGTLSTLGSQFASTQGKAFCFWLRTVDAGNIIPIGVNWFNFVGGGNNGYGLFMVNSKWTTDYAGEAGSVNFYPPSNSTSWAYWKATGVNFNDNLYHHHCLTWTGSATTPTLDYYIDGALVGGTWNDYSEGPTTTRGNFTGDVYLGCTQKSASNTLTDFASFRLADYRIYDRGLPADKVKEIYLGRGCDSVTAGLVARYPFQYSPINLGSYGVAAILANDNGITPTYNNDSVLKGVRRRVM